MRFFLVAGCALCLALAPAKAQSKKEKNPPNVSVSPVKVMADTGNQKFQEKNYPEAIVFFQQAYQLENNPGFLMNIALCYSKLEQWDNAKATYEAVLAGTSSENPLHQKAQEKLDELQKPEPSKKIDVVKTLDAVVLGKSDADTNAAKVFADEGNQKFKENQFQEAAELFRKAYTLDNRPGLLFNIGLCYSKLEQWSLAKDTYRLVIAVTEETNPMHQKSAEYLKEAEDKIAAAPRAKIVDEVVPIQLPEKRPTSVRLLYGSSTAAALFSGTFGSLALLSLYRTSREISDNIEITLGKVSGIDSTEKFRDQSLLFGTAAVIFLAASVSTRVAGKRIEQQTKVSVNASNKQVFLVVRY
jgi:tetratricopeptide (TPR) repeat protein